MNGNDSCAGSGDYPSDCDVTSGLLEKANARNAPVERSAAWKAALPRAKNIKLLLLDVDGVLTNGTITYTPDGGESKGFNTQDGFGLRILQEGGIRAGFITARKSEAVNRRAADLKLAYLYQGSRKKIDAYREILKESGLQPAQIAYMGDDWLDLQIIQQAGFAAAPANAVTEVKQRVHYVTSRAGGQGAVREVCDLLLEANGQLARLLTNYL